MPVYSPNSPASISPDGKRIAFIDAKEQISIYELDTGKLTTYTTSFLSYIPELEWSPDGEMLMYVGTVGGGDLFLTQYEIFILSPDTSETQRIITHERQFTYGGYNASWSSDGRWIGFWGRLHGTSSHIDEEFYLMDTSCITDPDTCIEKSEHIDSVSSYPVIWTPKGLLGFTCTIGDITGPCLLDVYASNTPYLLPDHPELLNFDGEIYALSWSLDSEYIVFMITYNNDDGSILRDLWIVRADGLGSVIKLTNTPEKYLWFNDWSLDMQYVAFSRGFGFEAEADKNGISWALGEIYTKFIDSNEVINLTNTPDEREDFAFWMVIPNRFEFGGIYQITTTGNDLNLRASPSLGGAVMKKLQTGDTITILEGPVQADGYSWWRMRTADGIEGWAVDVAGWYAPVDVTATPTLTPAP